MVLLTTSRVYLGCRALRRSDQRTTTPANEAGRLQKVLWPFSSEEQV